MVRKLTTHVHVDGTWYRPGDSPSPEVAKLITNPDVWDGPAEPTREASSTTSTKTASSVPDGASLQASDKTTESAPSVKQPPRKGPGSGGPAWTEFAARHGVTQSFDSKDALIGHLEAEGIIEKE